MTNPRRIGATWRELLEKATPSIDRQWALALRRRPHPVIGPIDQLIRVDLSIPSKNGPVRADVFQVHAGGADMGRTELHRWLREASEWLPSPSSGTFSAGFFIRPERTEIGRWTSRVRVGYAAAGTTPIPESPEP
jgi:hypothetical protein